MTGAFSESSCTPAVRFWPGRMDAAQSEPVQVTETFGTIVHFTPQELTTLVTLGSFHEIDQLDAARRPVASMLAT